MANHTNKAHQTALETARLNGIPENEVRHVVDTHFTKHFPCWRVSDHVVVYDDEPNCVVSIIAAPNRLQDI